MGLFAFQGRIHAPEFREGLSWFNTVNPLRMKDLRGRLVLLDFWTYCCINCMHVLPDLKFLEHRFAKQLTVIGVHSPKFPNEKSDENLRHAIARHNIEHPVVNDPDLSQWRQFGIRAWPTLALIDPEGIAVALAPGEGNLEALDELIAELIEIFREKGTLKEDIGPQVSQKTHEGPLLFPGKVWADPDSDQLWISDTNHHQILSIDPSGQVQTRIGMGAPGVEDGDFGSARFFQPQGLCRVKDTLFVADTENHLLRAIDLVRRRVETIAGTGEQAQPGEGPGPGIEVALNSPWDLCYADSVLYIAMAGSHQIWSYNPASTLMLPFAGSGQEARIDGPHNRAALAQPSGLTCDENHLYVADSEVSAIRRIGLEKEGKVDSLVGLDLFVFGDKDGVRHEVRLQHPLGVVYHRGYLWIADTFNHKIKRLDPKTQECRTFAGDGSTGLGSPDKPNFFEPGGIAARGEEIFVADTNHHRIVALNIATGEGREITIKN